MKQDVPPTPDAVPRKRRALAKVPDLWLAEWLARPGLSRGDQQRVERERRERRERGRVSRRVVGFVGTGGGMTKAQRQAVREALVGAAEAHHSGGWQADASFHQLCREQVIPVVLHPPPQGARPLKLANVLRSEPRSEQWGNEIVKACTELIAAPKEARQPVGRSGGVWGMVAYARHRATPVLIIMPNGQVGTDGH